MKSISAAIVVASGAALQVAACNAAYNRENASNIGVAVMFIGLVGWAYCVWKEQ
jgi:hypothetical protein